MNFPIISTPIAPVIMDESNYEWTNHSSHNATATVLTSLSTLLNMTTGVDVNSRGEHYVSALLLTIFISVVLSLLTLVTVVGNIFVIVAIRTDRNLRSVQNYLVFSLAVADLMVSILVMPISAMQEVFGEWRLGAIVCDIWTAVDVLSCTASILHLLAIAIDRYWAVTNIDYIQRRTPGRILGILAFVWGTAAVVSLAPVLGWKDPDFDIRIEKKECMVSQDVGYQIFATIATFYGPLVFILLLYWKIFQVRLTLPHFNTFTLTSSKLKVPVI